MEPLATHLFRFATAAAPDRVWVALTSGDMTARYFCGMTATSSWEPGSPVSFATDGIKVLAGEVLSAEWPSRLSYWAAAGPGQPGMYVTWEIRPSQGGSIVRLLVDDPDPDPDSDRQAEAGWLPVISRLQSLLDAEALHPKE